MIYSRRGSLGFRKLFRPMNFVKSNKKNNSKISLWYKLTYAGMCIKFRSKTDLERRFPRRDCFCWRWWYSRQRSLCLRKYSTESAPFIRILQGTFTQLTNCGYPTWPYLAQLSAQIRPNTVFGAHIWVNLGMGMGRGRPLPKFFGTLALKKSGTSCPNYGGEVEVIWTKSKRTAIFFRETFL